MALREVTDTTAANFGNLITAWHVHRVSYQSTLGFWPTSDRHIQYL